MATIDKEFNLLSALLYAKSKAQEQSNVDDGGTSNMDTPTVQLKGYARAIINSAFKTAKLVPSFQGDTIFILRACEGQGYRRTAMAEAFRDAMRKLGFNAAVDYRMD